MTNYNDGLWYGWNGGECPVHEDSVVDARYECGMAIDRQEAGDLTWEHEHYLKLIAFRVIKEYKEPREFWIVNSYIYTTLESAETYAVTFGFEQDEIIHAREVQE